MLIEMNRSYYPGEFEKNLTLSLAMIAQDLKKYGCGICGRMDRNDVIEVIVDYSTVLGKRAGKCVDEYLLLDVSAGFPRDDGVITTLDANEDGPILESLRDRLLRKKTEFVPPNGLYLLDADGPEKMAIRVKGVAGIFEAIAVLETKKNRAKAVEGNADQEEHRKKMVFLMKGAEENLELRYIRQ